jgi:hypothetical protein
MVTPPSSRIVMPPSSSRATCARRYPAEVGTTSADSRCWCRDSRAKARRGR